MRRIWAGQAVGDGVGPIGPAPARAGGPEILIGGYTPAAVARVGRWGNGFINNATAVAQTVKGFAGIGADELIFWPAVANVNQIDRLVQATSA